MAQIPSIAEARYWGDEPPKDFSQKLEKVREQRKRSGIGRNATVLALSGGGDDGAFAAGILGAWTERGDRPEFTIVTGVSTGALSAPFAFLGPEYDAELRRVYGGGLPRERIYRERSWLAIWPNASLADSSPLAALIADFADMEMLERIAREHRKGRRLLIQSTDLDAQRPVVWDLGAIAASGAPNALQVFRDALLASASMPGIFQPVLFEVEWEGEIYDEMHVDGGVISEDTVLFAWQQDLRQIRESDTAEEGSISLYIIRNGRVTAEPKPTDYELPDIAMRSISTMIKLLGINDLVLAYYAAQEGGIEFNVAWIGDDFNQPYPAPFDPGYMKALYQYGYDLMISGKAWHDKPPLF